MKKLFCFFSAVLLVISSCSSDDSKNSSSGFLKKIAGTLDDGQTYSFEYKYSGNKITKIIDSDGGYKLFTYTENLISKIETYSNNVLDHVKTYSYNSNNQLSSFIIVYPNYPNWGRKKTFTYNTNGTVTINYYNGDYNSQTNLYDTATVTFSNNQASQIFSSGKTNNYTYDNKNNPLKNVLGFDKIHLSEESIEGITNNITSMTSTNLDQSFINVFTYKSNEFPLKLEVVYNNTSTHPLYTLEYYYY
mgnify:CR=1 FL=1